jgi:hypothetical protein
MMLVLLPQMAILDSQISLRALECMFTVEEETG